MDFSNEEKGNFMASATPTLVFTNANVLDVGKGVLLANQSVTIAGDRITEVRPGTPDALPAETTVIDVGGRTLMPGLCDAHVHVIAWTANISQQTRHSPAYTTARAGEILEGMLMRGFTTVRDCAGADYGLAQAVDEDYLTGPRVLICGHALSQTGGHGDSRGPGERVLEPYGDLSLGLLCNGVPEVRAACRDEIRRGAHHIKLMLSGGVASPTDRLLNDQFSLDEIRAAVEEAEMAGLYVTGHTYSARAVNRAIECGVRSLEHCNLIDETSVELLLKHDAFMVPTLATYQALYSEGQSAGFPQELNDKLALVRDKGIYALDMAQQAGVKIAYGTDLLGDLHKHQLTEFAIRSQVQKPIDILRAATVNAAELFREEGETGVIKSGARADLLVVEGNPLEDLGCLQAPDEHLKVIMKGGKVYKQTL
ncbi:MAG: amidohydrolase family protein [Caldilineaceae bacterium]|nr:amidohydrolase family protein [Caldilineaceae bacterium]